MSTGIKIPTLLGIGVLLIGLFGGVFLVSQDQLAIFQTKATKSPEPQKITLVNLSGNSASVYWQTDKAATGFVEAGPNSSLGLTFNDDRDQGAPKPHKLHFVTLTNLLPNTTYYYKIASGANLYPNQPSSFKTSEITSSSTNSPLIGQVVDENLQPVDEALINLNINGDLNLATSTKISGNFVLPLTSLTEFTVNTPATLTAFNGEKSSKVNLTLPFSQTALPQIILGKDMDLVPLESSASVKTSISGDLNGDGVVNSLDSAIKLKSSQPKK